MPFSTSTLCPDCEAVTVPVYCFKAFEYNVLGHFIPKIVTKTKNYSFDTLWLDAERSEVWISGDGVVRL